MGRLGDVFCVGGPRILLEHAVRPAFEREVSFFVYACSMTLDYC